MPLARIGEKIIFFAHVPKTGGASVEIYLAAKGRLALKHPYTLDWSATTAQHMHAAVHRKLVPEPFIDTSFTIVRDPMARLISEFNYRSDREQAEGSFNTWAQAKLKALKADPQLDDNHLRPQVDFLRWNMLIFRFEDGLDPVFDWIDRYTKTEAGDRSARKNASTKRDVKPSAKTKTLVKKVYAQDYKMMDELDKAQKWPVRYKTIQQAVEGP